MPNLWTGSQWKVTNKGVETIDNRYFIEKSRVHDDEGGQWTWEDQMDEKGWVDMADFRRALAFARTKWPKK
ncbi:hypothetical protein [Bradyrhizobium lablabi]|nr:hypothetical protein [Bradyrhizobium lablabi]